MHQATRAFENHVAENGQPQSAKTKEIVYALFVCVNIIANWWAEELS